MSAALSGTRLRRWLEDRRAPLLLAGLASLLMMPALFVGFIADDWFHRIVLLRLGGWTDARPLRDLYAFFPAEEGGWRLDPETAWWTEASTRIRFGRPLSAFTHVLDDALWPDSPFLQHLHSLVWLALGVWIVAMLYRGVLAPGAAGLAGLLFAVEQSHVVVAGWLANRSALLCLVFGVAALRAHLVWRRTRAPRHLLLALALLAVGLGCGEAALAAAAYVLAWQVTCEEGPWIERLRSVVPCGALVVLWQVAYRALGFGASGASMYLDPGEQPLRFLGALVERAPLFLGGLLFRAPVDLSMFLPPAPRIAAAAVCGLLVCGLAWVLRGLLRRDARARFWCLGMVLSLVPFCTTFPQSRLLLFPAVGACGLLATWFEASGVWPFAGPSPAPKRRLAGALLVLHGPLAALLVPVSVGALPVLGTVTSAVTRQAPRGPEVAGQTFVFVNGTEFLLAYLQLMRTARGDAPTPRRMALLSSLATASRVERPDARTLVITTGPGWFHHELDGAFLRPGRRFTAGERVERPDYVAEIRSTTGDGRPLEVAFRFREPLESAGLRWLCWKEGRLVPFALPVVGAGTTLTRGF